MKNAAGAASAMAKKRRAPKPALEHRIDRQEPSAEVSIISERAVGKCKEVVSEVILDDTNTGTMRIYAVTSDISDTS